MSKKALLACAGILVGTAAVSAEQLVPVLAEGVSVRPTAMRGIKIENGQHIPTTDWIYLDNPGIITGEGFCGGVLAFDNAELDPVFGDPIGGDDGLCGQQGLGPTSRYYLISNDTQLPINSPINVNDFRVDPQFGGQPVNMALWGWAWGGDGNGNDQDCYVTILLMDEWAGDNCDQSLNQDATGVIFFFSLLPSGLPSYYTVQVDQNVCLIENGIDMLIPADGEGASVLAFSTTDPSQGDYTMAAQSQPTLWGTGDAESPPQDRPGGPNDFVQYAITGPLGGDTEIGGEGTMFGLLDFDPIAGDVCWDYGYGACIDPLGTMLSFWAVGDDVPECPIDFNGNGMADGGDFLLFLGYFFNEDPRADVNGDGQINGADFLAFLGHYFSDACNP